MYRIFIILKNKNVFVYLFNKIFFCQKVLTKKKFIYLFKILYNFGFFDFRIFSLLKKNMILNHGFKL